MTEIGLGEWKRIKAKEIYDQFFLELQKQGYEKPVAIEIGREEAEDMKSELLMMRKYSDSRSTLARNEMLYNGVLFVAPKNFSFDVPKPSPEDFK